MLSIESPPPPLLVVLVRYSTLELWEKESEPFFWLCKVASVLRIVEGPGEPAPFVHTWMSRSAWVLILVPSEHLVSPTLLLLLLPTLWFLVHPHPWSVRGFIVFFGRANPLQFGHIFIALEGSGCCS
jgi:hypothetical protein